MKPSPWSHYQHGWHLCIVTAAPADLYVYGARWRVTSNDLKPWHDIMHPLLRSKSSAAPGYSGFVIPSAASLLMGDGQYRGRARLWIGDYSDVFVDVIFPSRFEKVMMDSSQSRWKARSLRTERRAQRLLFAIDHLVSKASL